METSIEPAQKLQSEPLYEFSIYPFSTDPEGVQSIVSAAHGKSPEDLESVIGQAKAFYFTRTTGHKVTWENYVEWKKSHPLPFPNAPANTPGGDVFEDASTQSTGVDNPASLSFQQIAELIQTGQTHLIPNNRTIPEALHSDPPSESTSAARRKPWERGDGGLAQSDPAT